MLNSPTNIFNRNTQRSPDGPWNVDRYPGTRLVWLFLLLVLPFAAVGGRLVYLQGVLGEAFAADFEWTRTSYEPIPSRDGRILTTDGRVLARDVEHFNVLMHYRWLESPADSLWLKREALARLDRGARRDANRVHRAERKVLARREAMWDRLAELTDTPRDELDRRRKRIQRRVEKIVDAVRRRRRQQGESRRSESAPQVDPDAPWYWKAWNTALAALTTSPQPFRETRLVVKEEEDPSGSLDYHRVVPDVPLEVAAEIEAQPEMYPGLRIEVDTERVYPEGNFAPHVVGVRAPIREEELQTRRERFPAGDPLAYRKGDRIGRTGVERAYDRRLHGLRGRRKIVTGRRGQIIHTEIVRQPQTGGDVELTLDYALQRKAERLLDDALAQGGPDGGSLVALDVHTGEVLALASAPRFDLNLLVEPDPREWQQVRNDPRRPLFHRAIKTALPPGSTFKTLTAAAMLEDGRIDPDQPIHCRGYLDTPDSHRCYIYTHYGVGHGDMELSDAICRSCNVYFFTAARRMQWKPIVRWARRFGFGRPTGIDLPGESSGNLPSPEKPDSPWYPGDTLGLAIGQSRLTATPLQMARLMAAVAGDGRLVTPCIVRDGDPSVLGEADSVSLSAPQSREIPGLSDATLHRLRAALRKVVEHPRGTAHDHVHLDPVAVAGKTGTAEVAGPKDDHAWFAGYVPADNPRIAFAVVLEHGGSGGSTAGPLARQLIETMLELGIVYPARVASRDE